VNSPRKGRGRESEGTGSRARKAASRARKAATESRTSTGSASRARKAVSRPSTNDGVKGGGVVEAEHWVKGEEGDVEGGDGSGVEASKR
jgi:hypothetical protein